MQSDDVTERKEGEEAENEKIDEEELKEKVDAKQSEELQEPVAPAQEAESVSFYMLVMV